jgi:hypothetical protein
MAVNVLTRLADLNLGFCIGAESQRLRSPRLKEQDEAYS